MPSASRSGNAFTISLLQFHRSRNPLRPVPVITIGPCLVPWPGTALPYSLPLAQRRDRALAAAIWSSQEESGPRNAGRHCAAYSILFFLVASDIVATRQV